MHIKGSNIIQPHIHAAQERSNAAWYGTTQHDRGNLPPTKRHTFACGQVSHTSSQWPAQPASAPASRHFSSHHRRSWCTCIHGIPNALISRLLYNLLRPKIKYLLYVGCCSCYCIMTPTVSHIYFVDPDEWHHADWNATWLLLLCNMMEPTEETLCSTVCRVAVRLPLFWPDQPAIWFAQAEVQFELVAITCQQTKFNYVVSHLSQQVHQHPAISLLITDTADTLVITAFLPHSYHDSCMTYLDQK
jgi:hypothetical protein